MEQIMSDKERAQLKKLPRWIQSVVNILERKLMVIKAELEAINGKAGTTMGRWVSGPSGNQLGIPDHGHIEFNLDGGEEINIWPIYNDNGNGYKLIGLDIKSNTGSLQITPWASNCIKIKSDTWKQ